jgi:hypothetical protein
MESEMTGSHSMTRRLCLCLPPFLFALLDAGLTLHGQPHPYWSGDFSQPLELNPVGAWLLRQHPLTFALGVLCWALGVCTIIMILPARPAFWLAVLLALGHGVGVASWLLRLGPTGFPLALLFLLAAERLVRICWRRGTYNRLGTAAASCQFARDEEQRP